MGRPRTAKHATPDEVPAEEESQEVPESEPVFSSDAPAISKADAIRRTLTEGITSYAEAAAHIKKQYGLDITSGHFSASKSREGDKRAVESTPSQVPAPTEPAPPAPEASTMSKADVCRTLIAEGITDNEEAVSAAKARFGIEIKATDYSLYKSKAKQQDNTPKGKPGRKPAEESAPKPAPANPSVGMIGDLTAVRDLVKKLGAEQVRQIVDLFE